MAKTIKGLTVEIDGNTTKLSKALDDVNKESRDISSELKQIEQLLKFNPKNVEVLEQKQQLLAKAVENTKKKLETLEDAQEDVNKQFANGEIGEEQYRAFQREIIKTKSQLEGFEGQLNDTQADLAHFATGADKATKELKDLEKQAGDTANKVDDVGKKSESSVGKMAAVGYAVGQIGDKMSEASGKILDFGNTVVDTYKDVSRSMSQFEVTADRNNLSIDDMEESLRKMVGMTGELDSSTEAINNLMNSGANADQVAEAVNQFAGAVTMFPDTLKFESLADSLQESVKTGAMTGQFAELLERLGYNLDEVNEKFANATTEQQKMDLALQLMSEQGLSQAGDDFIALNQAMYDNNTKTHDLRQAMADMGELLMPMLNNLIDLATSAIEWFNGLDETWQAIIIVLGGVIALLGPLLALLGPLIIMAGGLNVAMLPMIGTIALVVAAVLAIIAAGVALYKNWDKVKEKMISIGNSIKDFFKNLPEELKRIGGNIIDGLVNGIKSKVQAVTNAVKNVTSAITGKVKSILGIRSPSRVMMEMGEYTGEGLALGIEDTIDRVEQATRNLSNRVTETIGNTRLGNNTIVNNTNPYMEVVVPIDGKVVARQTVQYTAQELDRYGSRKSLGKGISYAY